MVKKIICLGVVLIMIFSLGACGEKYVIDFIEEETEDMIELGNTVWSDSFSLAGITIKLKHPDEDAFFECTVDKGTLSFAQGYGNDLTTIYDKKITIKPGSQFTWNTYKSAWPYGNVGKGFIDIILKVSNKTIGYAVIEINKINLPNEVIPGKFFPGYEAKLLKAALIPKVNEEYQNITEKQIKNAIKNIK